MGRLRVGNQEMVGASGFEPHEARREKIRESLKAKRNTPTLPFLPTSGTSLDDAKPE
jgi:hypothetical protein